MISENNLTPHDYPGISNFMNACDKIILYYDYKKIIYDPNNCTITYRATISPSAGEAFLCENFPPDITVSLPQSMQSLYNLTFEHILQQIPFSSEFEHLPPGISHDCFLTYKSHSGLILYYSNKYWSYHKNAIISDPIHSGFELAFLLLSLWGPFSPALQEKYIPAPTSVRDTDLRYFEETIWICKKCKTANLMEHKFCINCKSPRE